MLTERDTVNKDGTLNWRAIREIATLRALAERDIEVIELVYGAPIRKPADVGFHNIREWRARVADMALAANPSLETTPYIVLYRRELRRALDAARAVRSVLRRRDELTSGKVVSLSVAPRVRLINQLLGSLGRAS